jgi:hypothetical protein
MASKSCAGEAMPRIVLVLGLPGIGEGMARVAELVRLGVAGDQRGSIGISKKLFSS